MSAPKVLILIPARMAATRLPGKPLADVGGRPMIVEVARRAVASGLGRVAVATDDPAIADAVRECGVEAVMTRTDHPSGSDRIHEALAILDPAGVVDIVVNVQGDLPTIKPETIRQAVVPLADPAADIATLAAVITEAGETTDPHVVKVVGSPVGEGQLNALYFTRATAPYGEGPLYHHIGLYAFRRKALERFVKLPPSPLEQREKLEQLRALEAGMRIRVAVVDEVPLGVDTQAHLDRAREILAREQQEGISYE